MGTNESWSSDAARHTDDAWRRRLGGDRDGYGAYGEGGRPYGDGTYAPGQQVHGAWRSQGPDGEKYEGGIGTGNYVSDFARHPLYAYGGSDAYRDRDELAGLPSRMMSLRGRAATGGDKGPGAARARRRG